MAQDNTSPRNTSEDSRPTPDPTILTTQYLQREIKGLRELVELRIKGLGEEHTEKFCSVNKQLKLMERQRVEQKADTKNAVDAALAAAKSAVNEQTAASEKAISKSETATNELLKSQANTQSTANASFLREIGDIRTRLTTIEQKQIGAKEDRTGIYAAIGAVGVILSIIVVAANTLSK